jgi:hypothetical protein
MRPLFPHSFCLTVGKVSSNAMITARQVDPIEHKLASLEHQQTGLPALHLTPVGAFHVHFVYLRRRWPLNGVHLTCLPTLRQLSLC